VVQNVHNFVFGLMSRYRALPCKGSSEQCTGKSGTKKDYCSVNVFYTISTMEAL
jgi:hypothetical protein